MISRINGRQVGNQLGHRVVDKSFPGATADDMRHYIKPTITKNPEQVLIHVGTNDLQNSEPAKIADTIVDLAREITNNTDAKVALSELVTRGENKELSAKVKETNRLLRRFCNQHINEIFVKVSRGLGALKRIRLCPTIDNCHYL